MIALKKQMHGVVSGHGGKALKDSEWPSVGSAVRCRRVLHIALELRYQSPERLGIFLEKLAIVSQVRSRSRQTVTDAPSKKGMCITGSGSMYSSP